MYWNHRLIRFTETGDTEAFHKFAEVYYNDDGTLMGYSDPFMLSETVEGMQGLAERLLKATTLPVLDESDFPKEVEGDGA